MLFVGERLERFGSFFIDEENFSWLDLPHKFGPDEVKSAGLGGNDGRILQLTKHQGPEAKWIPGGHHFLFCQDEQRVGPFDLFEGVHHPLNGGFLLRTCDEVNDHLGIHVRLENGSLGFELAFNQKGIGEIAVVGYGKASLVIIYGKRLSIFEFARTSSGISDMTDGTSPRESLQNIFCKHF